MKSYYVYILSNSRRTVLYIGVTGHVEKRLLEHELKSKKNSFTGKYNVDECIYCEEYANPTDAIAREKQLKGWTRIKKEILIKRVNPELRNLLEE